MAKKSTLQRVKDKISGTATQKVQNASKAHPSPENWHSSEHQETYQTGIKGKKSPVIDPDSPLGKLETRLKDKGLSLKFEHAHHLSITITRETPDSTAQISGQTGENLIQSEADFLYDRAVNELLGGAA